MFGRPAAAKPAAPAITRGGGPSSRFVSHANGPSKGLRLRSQARKRAPFGKLYLPGWQCRPLVVGAMRARGLRPSPEGFVEASWAWRSCPIILTCENKQKTKLWERTI
jgi:hypothetical protein